QAACERPVDALAQLALAFGRVAVVDRRRAGPPADEQAAVFSRIGAHPFAESRRRSARVEGVEELRVLLVDDVALDLQGRRQLARRLGEVVVEDAELLDLLDLRVFRVRPV